MVTLGMPESPKWGLWHGRVAKMVTLGMPESPKWWLWHADASIEKSAQFHAERTDREVLGCPMARYSGVVVFHVVKSHADAFIEKSAQFHAERTDRDVLGRPVARYSGVVVFHVVK